MTIFHGSSESGMRSMLGLAAVSHGGVTVIPKRL